MAGAGDPNRSVDTMFIVCSSIISINIWKESEECSTFYDLRNKIDHLIHCWKILRILFCMTSIHLPFICWILWKFLMRCEGSMVKRRKFSIQHLIPNYQEKALSRFDTQSYTLVFSTSYILKLTSELAR